MNIIELKQVTRAFRKSERVLENLDLTVGQGEIVGLIGRNGSGKTTLIQTVLGMLKPQRGEVRVFGLDPVAEPVAVKQRIGYVAEHQILPGSMSLREVFAIYADLYPEWDAGLADDLVKRFELPSGRKVNTFSKGQGRSLALLLALSVRPDLLVLDEPAGGMDPAARRDFLSTSIEHAAASGATILFSSHQMTDVERLSSRVLLLHGGRIALDRPIEALSEQFALATVPVKLDCTRMREVRGYVGDRRGRDSVSVLFERSAGDLQAELEAAFGTQAGSCRNIPLEELFIEFVGGSGS
jgi:ABC-2 type transport system ATP-binding protein